MLIRLLVVLFCLLPVLSAGPADKPIGHLQAALDLKPEQVSALRSLREARNTEIEGIRTTTKLAENRKALKEECKAVNPNPMTVGQTLLLIQASEKLIAEAKARYAEAAKALLTEQQANKLRQLRRALKMEAAAKQAVSWGIITAPRKKY